VRVRDIISLKWGLAGALDIIDYDSVGVLYPEYHGSSPITTQQIGYDLFPSPAHGWGTKHPISNEVPLLLVENEGSPTQKKFGR
jgi:hypothetical protein